MNTSRRTNWTFSRATCVALAALLVLLTAVRAAPLAPPVNVPDEWDLLPDADLQSSRRTLEGRNVLLRLRYEGLKNRSLDYNNRFKGRKLDPDSPEAAEGRGILGALQREIGDYSRDAAALKKEVDQLVDRDLVRFVDQDPIDGPLVRGLEAMGRDLGWDPDKQARLDVNLHHLYLGHAQASRAELDAAWTAIRTRGEEPALTQEAAQGQGPSGIGAGEQTKFNDCTIFALANAAGVPYGVVGARATKILADEPWRSVEERTHPQAVIEKQGMNGGEVLVLAEALGQARVIDPKTFPDALKAGQRVLVSVRVSADAALNHEVVLTRTFQHAGKTWYEMADSKLGPQGRRFLSAHELGAIISEKGVAFAPEPHTTPALLR